MSGQTSLASVFVHALVFASVYSIATHAYWHMKMYWRRRKLMRFAHEMERQTQTAALFDIYDMQAQQGEALRSIAASCAPPAVVAK